MPSYDNFGSADKTSSGAAMPLPALALPIISALGQGLQGYLQNKGQQQQQQQQAEQIEIQKRRLQYERAQQLRGNAMEDAQGHALNPIRSNLYASLAQRLGLPAGTFAFGAGAPQQNAPHRAAPGMPPVAGADPFNAQAYSEGGDYQSAIAMADKLAMNPFTRSVAEKLRLHAQQQYRQAMGGG